MISKELESKLYAVFEEERIPRCELTFEETGFTYYNYENNYGNPQINMDLIMLEKEYEKIKKKQDLQCSFVEYAIITLLHEVGHAKDDRLMKSKIAKRRIRMRIMRSKTKEEIDAYLDRYMTVVMQVEERAWIFVEQKNVKGLQDEVSKVAEYCLQLYRESRKDYERTFSPKHLKSKA